MERFQLTRGMMCWRCVGRKCIEMEYSKQLAGKCNSSFYGGRSHTGVEWLGVRWVVRWRELGSWSSIGCPASILCKHNRFVIHDYLAEACYFKVLIFSKLLFIKNRHTIDSAVFLGTYQSSHRRVPVFKRKVCVNIIYFVNFLFLFPSKSLSLQRINLFLPQPCFINTPC